jgi:hypothetical protein
MESPEMVRRYAHFSAEHLAPYADRLRALRVADDPADGTLTAQAINEKGLAVRKPLIIWRARQDLNPRPPGS